MYTLLYIKQVNNRCLFYSTGNYTQYLLITYNQKSKRVPEKNIYLCFIDYAKAFDCVDHKKLENSERDGNTRPPDLPPERQEVEVRKQQLELDMEQQTGSK